MLSVSAISAMVKDSADFLLEMLHGYVGSECAYQWPFMICYSVDFLELQAMLHLVLLGVQAAWTLEGMMAARIMRCSSRRDIISLEQAVSALWPSVYM